ncbi:MAG: hypothetical protein R3C44_08315 [Chloroflexota bacterium]
MKDRLPEGVIGEVFQGVVDSVLEEHRGEFEHLEIEKRLDYLVKLLTEEGFLSKWEQTEDGYTLIEYSCPYISVGNNHAEICHFDKQLILGVLEVPVQQQSCMLNGEACCQFTVENVAEPELALELVAG